MSVEPKRLIPNVIVSDNGVVRVGGTRIISNRSWGESSEYTELRRIGVVDLNRGIIVSQIWITLTYPITLALAQCRLYLFRVETCMPFLQSFRHGFSSAATLAVHDFVLKYLCNNRTISHSRYLQFYFCTSRKQLHDCTNLCACTCSLKAVKLIGNTPLAISFIASISRRQFSRQ